MVGSGFSYLCNLTAAAVFKKLAEHFEYVIAAHNKTSVMYFPSWDNYIIPEILR